MFQEAERVYINICARWSEEGGEGGGVVALMTNPGISGEEAREAGR